MKPTIYAIVYCQKADYGDDSQHFSSYVTLGVSTDKARVEQDFDRMRVPFVQTGFYNGYLQLVEYPAEEFGICLRSKVSSNQKVLKEITTYLR